MNPGTCDVCGKSKRTVGARTCSRSCSNSLFPRRKSKNFLCVNCKNSPATGGTFLRSQCCSASCFNDAQISRGLIHPCSSCGQPAPNSRKTCSSVCSSRAGNDALVDGVKRKPKATATSTCKTCGKSFSGRKMFCSSKCRRKTPEELALTLSARYERMREHRKNKQDQGYTRVKISSEDRKSLQEEQGYYCAVKSCEREARVLDHDHSTGEPRAFLCYMHNTALGAFNDDPDYLQEGIDYLRSFTR